MPPILTPSYFALAGIVEAIEAAKAEVTQLFAERDILIGRAFYEGTSRSQIADATGISRQRVDQIIQADLNRQDRLEIQAMRALQGYEDEPDIEAKIKAYREAFNRELAEQERAKLDES